MIEINKIEEFTANIENLTINVNEIIVEQFVALPNSNLPRDTAFTNLWQETKSTILGNDLDLRGKIHLFMKNQRDYDMTSLFLTISLRVKAHDEIDTSNVFTKSVQYLFGWTKKYAEENDILGKDGNPFIVPEFPYSKSQLEILF